MAEKPRKKRPPDDRDRKVLQAVDEVAAGVHAAILRMRKPELDFPIRSLANVRYDPKVGYFEIGRRRRSALSR